MANVKVVLDRKGIVAFVKQDAGIRGQLESIANAKCEQLNGDITSHGRSGKKKGKTYEKMNAPAFAVKVDNVAKIQGWPVALIHPTNSIAYKIATKYPPSW